jgi:hypothetical protein
MVDTGFASAATLQLDGSASPAVALWRLVGALTQEQTRTVVSADAAPTPIISDAKAIKMHRHPLNMRARA